MTNLMTNINDTENMRQFDRAFLDYAISLAQELDDEGNSNLARDIRKLVCISRYYLSKDAITILREVA